MPWKTPGGLGGRAPQSQNHLPFPKKRIFRLANRKLVESKALSPRSQLQDVTKHLDVESSLLTININSQKQKLVFNLAITFGGGYKLAAGWAVTSCFRGCLALSRINDGIIRFSS